MFREQARKRLTKKAKKGFRGGRVANSGVGRTMGWTDPLFTLC